MRTGSIYAYCDPVMRRPVYTGLTTDGNNLRRHREHLKSKNTSKFERWLQSFPEGQEPKPREIERVEYDDEYVLHCREDHWMFLLQTLKIFGKGGLNQIGSTPTNYSEIARLGGLAATFEQCSAAGTLGGATPVGDLSRHEHLTRIASLNKGIPKSEEHRAKLSAAAKKRGTAHLNTPEIQARKSQKLKGRVFSEETRRKMSEAQRARNARDPEALLNARAARGVQLRDDISGRFAPASVEEVK